MDGTGPGRTGKRAETLRNFVLSGKKVLSGNSGKHGFYVNAGKKLYPERKTEPQAAHRKSPDCREKATDMNNDLLNILSNSNKDIDNQQLMDYLSGKLSGREQHEIEQSMADNDFMNDAVEGLQHFGDKKDIQDYVVQLNADLQKNLQKKKQRRDK